MAWDLGETGAVATITRRAADRCAPAISGSTGRMWNGLGPEPTGGGNCRDGRGGRAREHDRRRGIPLGTALYSAGSEIALRMVSPRPGVGRAEYLGELRERVEAALRLRKPWLPKRSRPPAKTTPAASSSPKRTTCPESSPTATTDSWSAIADPGHRAGRRTPGLHGRARGPAMGRHGRRASGRPHARAGTSGAAPETPLFVREAASPHSRPSSRSTACASTSTPQPDRRPEPSSTSD